MSIARLDVVVPARDEEELLPRCLASIEAAAVAVDPGLPVTAIVVLDSCTDGSAEVVEAARLRAAALRASRPHPERAGGFEVVALQIDAGNVGAARAAGVHLALARAAAAGTEPRRHWICSTDADTEVPADWLATHLRVAEEGAALALGRVSPRRGDLPEERSLAWHRAYRSEERPVHGANLGVRADVYRASGGFQPVDEHEDVRLALSVQRLGHAPTILPGAVVTTSGRLDGRTPGGFAGYLRALGDAL